MVQKLKKICDYFSKDLTASETSKKLNLSRQTINHYYKMIRDSIVFDTYILDENIFHVEYIKFQKKCFFYIINNDYIYLLDEDSQLLSNLNLFLKEQIEKNLINNSKANAIRIVYNNHTNNFTIVGFYNSSNDLQDFINNRLKKFRGIKKDNLYSHIKESIFRFNLSSKEINKKLLTNLSI